MQKIVVYLKNQSIITITVGILSVVLFVLEQTLLAGWCAHIFCLIYFLPVSYGYSAGLSLKFCSNFTPLYEKNNVFEKKVKLNSFTKRMFCGYDDDGNLLLSMVVFQSILLVYICVFLFCNIVFLTMLALHNLESINWIRVWIAEIIALIVLFNIVRLSYLAIDAYLESKEEKHKVTLCELMQNDKKTLKYKRILKLKGKIEILLKQYGLQMDKKNNYILSSDNVEQVETALKKEFPNVYTTYSETQKGEMLFEIYDAKDDFCLMKAKIKNK